MKKLALLFLLFALPAHAENELAQYATAKTIYFCLYDAADPTDMQAGATFAAGDVVITIDGGTPANATNTPTDEGNCYSLALTAAELTGQTVSVEIIDQTVTKVWIDHDVIVQTYGNASAEHPFMAEGILNAIIEDEGSTYTLQCFAATLLAYAGGVVTTSSGVSTYQDPGANENRLVGTVSATGRSSITITCP